MGVELYEGVLSTFPPSALPMHINLVKDLMCACPFVNLVFCIKVYSLILQEEFQFINLETFTAPPTARLHARKRQELYTNCSAQTIQTYICTCTL